LEGWQRGDNTLREIPVLNGWTSPGLGIRFDSSGGELKIFGPDGRPFLTYQEMAQERDRIAQERDQIAHERDAERQRTERMAAQLRAMGIEPAE